MENLLQELQKSFERRRQITFDNSNIKAQITEKVGQLSRIIESTSTTDSKSKHQFSGQSPVVTELKDTIENLKTRLRESERRCALESLRYEELLLELESSQMRQKYDMLDDASSGFGAHSLLMAASTSPRDALNDLSDELHSRIGERMNQGWDLTNFGKFRGDEEWASPTKVPAPRGISLEKQLMHSIIVSWKPPEFQANDQEEEVTAYHVYADGQFRASVGGHEKRRALVENIDASKQHRISIRTVTSRGQSKDAECTLLVGKGASPAPTRLKASHITTNSCKLSWLPGSSNFYHAIFLNNHELRVCPPGVYKLFLTGLHPNTLHCVRVESKCSSGSNEPPPACQTTQRNPSSDELKRNAVTIEFHTAPVGLPSPPRNVQVEAGPQDGVLLISWRPVPQATHVFPKCENEQLVQGYTVCINDHPLMDVPGAERDHVLLPLRQLATLLRSSEFALAPPKQFPNQFFTQKEVSAEDASQSTGDSLSDIRNEELELIENQQDAKNDDPLDLRLTVHSTLSSNTGFAGNRGGDVLGKRDRSGPASPSISLMPSLLLIAAGSLEAAVELFGKKLAKRLGLNENSAAVACVSLRRSNPVYISIEKPVMDAERSDNPDSVEDDPGIVQVYAGNITGIAKTSSPTSDALDSAEALLRKRQSQKHRYGESLGQQHPQYRRETWSSGYWPLPYYGRHSVGTPHPQSHCRHRNEVEQPSLPSDSVYHPRRGRLGRYLRPTRSMSDENDCLGSQRRLMRLPYSTESTESERQHQWKPVFTSTRSSLDLREESHRRGRYVCKLHRSPPLGHYTNPRAFLMRRSKSLGRPHAMTLISSSSNDEGFSKAYFQRLQERGHSRGPILLPADELSRGFYRDRRQHKVPFGAANSSSEWGQEDFHNREKLRIGKSPTERLVPKHWLQKITSVPEIPLSRSSRDYYNGAIGNRHCYGRKWEETGMDEVGEEEDNRIGSVENGDAYGWSRGSQCNPRNRRIRHSDPVSRGARSPVTPGRKAANCGLGYSTGDRPPKGTDRENPRRGSRNLHQSEPCSKSDRKSGTSPLRPPITEDGCVYLVSLYDYDPATMSPNPGAVDDELPFKEGDIIKVYGDCDEDGFYFGECKGRRGFVPSNMVCEANADEVADYLRQRCPVRGRSTTESSRPLPPGQMKKPHRSRAHHPPVPDQPSGHLDDRPRNVNVDAGGNAPRAFLKHRHLRSGKAEYTEGSKSTRQSGSTDQCIRKRRGTHRPRQCVMEALYDYDPHIYSPNVDVETELKFRAGDRILILSEMDEDGFYVGELESSGRQGLVPSNFLREIPRVSSEGKPRLVNGGDDDDNDSWRNPVYGSTESERGIQPLRESRPSTHSSSRARSKAYPNSGDLESIARPRKPPGKPQENESRQLSRSRISADNDRLDINYVDDDGEGEEDSIITSTVPPANPVEWSNTPFQIPVTTAQQSVTTDHMSSPMMVSNDPGPSLTRTPESEIPKDSFDSDGQEAVIIMDIKSNKHSKSRRKVLSRNSSNEHEHDPGDTKTRRRSVFRSPFKRDSSHN